MRRFVTLVFLLFFTIPFGISIAGCGHKSTPVTYCNGGDSGPVVGQLFSIVLQPKLYGLSLNYGEQGQVSSPAGTDCKGTAVSGTTFTYGTTDMTLADVAPSTGRLCAGTWNRNTGGGIADYTTCNATGKTGTAYVTASSNGVSSNPIAIYIHPIVTSVVLGSPSSDCTNDPASNCTIDPTSNKCVLSAASTAPPYAGTACVSQGNTAQLAARVYAGTGSSQQNISCYAGHLTYTAQDSTVVSIDQTGIVTAQAPGATIISANLSNASSSAGSFGTCPPASVTLSVPGSSSTNITVNQNFAQPITATVKDTNGVILNNINLTFESTAPTTLPSGSAGTVTPILPGAGSITAVCQPPTCNQAPLIQLGLFGNGKPVVSNPINITTPGTSSTVLFIGSTDSQYISPVDFTTQTSGSPVQPAVRLPYAPNSMVMSIDGANIYMGSTNELMVFNALTSVLAREDNSVSGKVLSVSPDGNTLVMTDPVRQLVYLLNASAGGVQSSVGGVGTRAAWTPDSSTVYITAGDRLLVHSTYTGWTTITGSTVPPLSTIPTDVAVTVPTAGAFFAGATTTARGNCHVTTVLGTPDNYTTTNVLYPDAGVVGPMTDLLSTTNDGKHAVGVTATPVATLADLSISTLNSTNPTAQGQCPTDGSALKFGLSGVSTKVLPGITATKITGVVSSSDSANVFVTYTGTGGVLPLYVPSAGTVSNVGLATYASAAPVAPVAGVFSSDNTTFYVGTSGDNLLHILTKSGSTFTDTTKPIIPALPSVTSGIATPNLLVQKPRKIT
jgi:hypothetical protein